MSTGDSKGFRFRESTRAPYKTEVALRFERDGEATTGHSANVSMEGMFVETNDPRPVGTLVQFEFHLEGAAVQGLGDVVWIRTRPLGSDKPPGMGIQFRYVDPQSRDHIARIVDRYLQEGKGRTGGDEALETTVSTSAAAAVEDHSDPMEALLAESQPAPPPTPPPQPARAAAPPEAPIRTAEPPAPLPTPEPPMGIGDADDGGEGDSVEMLEIRDVDRGSRRWLWGAVAAVLLVAILAVAWGAGLLGGDGAGPVAEGVAPEVAPPVEEPRREAAAAAAEAETAEVEGVESEPEPVPLLDAEEDYSSDFEGLDEEPLEPLPTRDEEPEPVAAPSRAPEPATPAPVATAPRARALTDVVASPGEDGTTVVVRADGPLDESSFSVLRLTGPPRLVVRISGIERPFATGGVRGAEFQRLRSGLHEAAGGERELHLVFDLTSESVRSVVEARDGVLRIRLRP